MSYKLKEYTRKEQILIWICSIILIVLSFIGMATIYACFTNKIEIVKAEEQEQVYYQFNMPQNISYNDMQILVPTAGSTLEFYIPSGTSNEGIMYNDNDYNYQYTTYRIKILTYNSNTRRSFEISVNSNENDPITRAITVEYYYANDTTQWEYDQEASFIGNQNTEITLQNFLSTIWKKSDALDNYLTTNNLTSKWEMLFSIDVLREVQNTIQLQAPTITLNLNTIHWQYIENADFYNVFKDGQLIGQTYYNSWVTIENGIYTVQACTNNTEEYGNSNLSNSITQNNYNDMIGNGINWFSFFSAFVDSQIYLMKSMLNYTIWDINFFQLFTFIITIILTVFIIKFIKGW